MVISKRMVAFVAVFLILVVTALMFLFEKDSPDEHVGADEEIASDDPVIAELLAKAREDLKQSQKEQKNQKATREAVSGFDEGVLAEISSSDPSVWLAGYQKLLNEIRSVEPREFATNGTNIVYLMNVYVSGSERQQYSAAVLYNLALAKRFGPPDATAGFPRLGQYDWLRYGLRDAIAGGGTSETRRMAIETYGLVFGLDKTVIDQMKEDYSSYGQPEKVSIVQAAYYGVTRENSDNEDFAMLEEVVKIAANDDDVSNRVTTVLCLLARDEGEKLKNHDWLYRESLARCQS